MGGGEGVKLKKKTIYFFILNHFKKAKAFRGVVQEETPPGVGEGHRGG